MAKFRKLDPRIWRDERFVTLSPEEKLVAVYCLTAQVNRCGIFVFSPGMAAEELGMSPETFGKRFDRVVLALRWGWDYERRVIFFPHWWRYNTPENPNVFKGCLSDLSELPETPLLAKFYGNTGDLAETFHSILTETLAKRLAVVSPQEQEQEQEQETPTEVCSEPPKAASSEPPVPPVPDSPILMTFPTTGSGPREWHLTEAKVEEYRTTFPGLDVLAEFRLARQWCIDNTAKRKTARGMPAFLTRWLSRVQDRGPRSTPTDHGPNGFVKSKRMAAIDALIDRERQKESGNG